MRVERFLSQSAEHHADKTALCDDKERISYTRWEQSANQVAHLLKAHGVQRGDRVVIVLDNCVASAVSIFAVMKAGAVFSPVNPTIKADKLGFILSNCRASAVITHERLLPMVEEARLAAPWVRSVFLADGAASADTGAVGFAGTIGAMPTTPPPTEGIDIDLAMLIYTSGSTGLPKGVMMTHQNIVTASASITTYLQNTPTDIILSVLPLSFDYGLYQVLMAAQIGMTVLLEKSFAFPGKIMQKLREERVTGFPLVPTIAAILLQMRDLAPGFLPHLRYLTNTAAALPPAHIQRLIDLFPGAQIYSMYGLTERKRCTYLPPEQLAARPGSVGKAIPNTEAYIVDEQGNRVGPGVVGELVIRGGHVMKGYWEDPAATERVLRPGPVPGEKVLHTGDLFRVDDDGFLYFVARKDDIIKTRGEKVSPKEVENVLYGFPGVQEAAVVGVPDRILGMALKAFVVIDPILGVTERQLIAHCARHLEDFMVPKSVEFRADLPKTDTGKIRRSEVQAEVLRAAGTASP